MNINEKFRQLYSFTTENLSGYYPLINFNNKNVLTVNGSGDHLINAYVFGAKDVTCFDINPFSKYFTELKLKALSDLSMDEFLNFLLINVKKPLDYNVYKQLRKDLSDECKLFFDKQYLLNNNNGKLLRNSGLFNNKYDNKVSKIKNNPYLQSEELFNDAKKSKMNSWINCDIRDLSDLISEDFDVILLSNIADYAKLIYNNNYLVKFRDEIINPLMNHLNPDGMIAIAYIYAINSKSYRTDIDNPIVRKNIFCNSQELIFESIINNEKDEVLFIKKCK